MKIALVGYGRMGRAVEEAALEAGHAVVAKIDAPQVGKGVRPLEPEEVDVAIDFSLPEAVPANVALYAGMGIDLVVGTTGWYSRLDEVEATVAEAGTALLYAPNFSLGVHLFFRLARAAARIADRLPEYDVHLWEHHHRHKADHPSGTAGRLAELLLEELSRKEGWVEGMPGTAATGDGPLDPRLLQLSVLRAGEEPGTHGVGIDGPNDRIELVHRARSREGFATGALRAAEWLTRNERTGIFTMDDCLADLWEGER